MKKTLIVILTAVAVLLGGLTIATPAQAAKAYSTCTVLAKDYPQGIAHPRARVSPKSGTLVWQKVSGKRVQYRASKVSKSLYRANVARDGDKDSVVCER